jgi:hypothetical protein
LFGDVSLYLVTRRVFVNELCKRLITPLGRSNFVSYQDLCLKNVNCVHNSKAELLKDVFNPDNTDAVVTTSSRYIIRVDVIITTNKKS